MRYVRSIGRLSAVAAAGFLAVACADSATAPTASLAGETGPSSSLSTIPVTTANELALEGKVEICKSIAPGAPAATFDFAVVVDGGTPTTVSVPSGTCVLAYEVPTTTGRFLVEITEQPKTNWFLTDIDIARLRVFSDGGGLDEWNIATATARVRVNDDLGRRITFFNDYTPPAGCTLTQGYWKTHSEHGPARYDDTWALLTNGANTPFFLSGKTWYEVFHTAPAGNAYYNLAHQYMAAKLNELSGASVPSGVATAMSSAVTLFSAYTPAQVAALSKQSTVRRQFIALAETLDGYNNGVVGPGHCE